MHRFLSLLTFAAIAIGQCNAQQPQTGCSSPQTSQFDFWTGEWELTWPPQPGGQPGRGTNTIRKVLDGCVIEEHFKDTTSPFRGMSVSTWNAQAKHWKQTWVDNNGSYLDFTGEFANGQMILSREAVDKDGNQFHQRMVWKDIKPDSFDWSWERSEDGGKTWKVVWPIHYQRKH
jgi:hypothetical protein